MIRFYWFTILHNLKIFYNLGFISDIKTIYLDFRKIYNKYTMSILQIENLNLGFNTENGFRQALFGTWRRRNSCSRRRIGLRQIHDGVEYFKPYSQKCFNYIGQNSFWWWKSFIKTAKRNGKNKRCSDCFNSAGSHDIFKSFVYSWRPTFRSNKIAQAS